MLQCPSIRQVPKSFRCEEAWELTERRDGDDEWIASFGGQLCNLDRPANPTDAVVQAGRYCDDRGLRCDLRMQLAGRPASISSGQETVAETVSGVTAGHPFSGHVCSGLSTVEAGRVSAMFIVGGRRAASRGISRARGDRRADAARFGR